MSDITTFSGKIDRIIYPRTGTGTDDGFKVILFQPSKGTAFTASGILLGLAKGSKLRITGEWGKYRGNDTFRIKTYEEIIPRTKGAIEKYLCSGTFSKIGSKTAKAIVDKFGKDSLTIIGEQPERLKEIPGIGDKTIAEITESWNKQRDIESLMVFLKEYDIPNKLCKKIYDQWGSDSITVIRENPYRLCGEIKGIGFPTSDRIAKEAGIAPGSPFRIRGGVLHTLTQALLNGDVFLYRDFLTKMSAQLLGLPENIVESEIPALLEFREIIKYDDKVYLPQYFFAEKNVATKLVAMSHETCATIEEESASELSETIGVVLDPIQVKAVHTAVSHQVCVITGGPGTGKTTITRAIISLYEKAGLKVLLAAPTGRAAKRMSEATSHEAQTIHRLLGASPGGGFASNEDNPVSGDALIVDEASMIDLMLMHALLRALPKKMRLVIVGDMDQLPSVGAGNVLKDIIEADTIPTVKLTTIFRQKEGSAIVTNAHLVNEGRMPVLRGNNDFFFVPAENENIQEKILALIQSRLPKYCNVKPEEIQVLSPMHGGAAGTESLNAVIQQACNPASDPNDELQRGNVTFRTGDKIMATVNDYDNDVYNGDLGIITSIDRKNRRMYARFDDNDVVIEGEDLFNVELAYCCTIHKSQGSEYPVTVVVASTSHYIMLQRNLLYTGITRSKRCCVIVGSRQAIEIMVENNRTVERNTRLMECIRLCEIGWTGNGH